MNLTLGILNIVPTLFLNDFTERFPVRYSEVPPPPSPQNKRLKIYLLVKKKLNLELAGALLYPPVPNSSIQIRPLQIALIRVLQTSKSSLYPL